MGVWIEITIPTYGAYRIPVTPYVGVWIEIPSSMVFQPHLWSPPMWGCGLK